MSKCSSEYRRYLRLEQFVDDLLLRIGDMSPIVIFLFFFVSGFLQIAFPPYPGDTVLIFGGCLKGLALETAGLLAFIGYLSATVVTSLLLFELGFRLNERIFKIRWIAGIMPVEKRAEVESKYKRFGIGLLAVCKFIPGVNTLVILLGGVLRYPRAQAMPAIVLSSLLHNLIFFYVGHTLGSNLDGIKHFTREYTLIAAVVAIAALAAAVVYFVLKNRKETKES